MWVQDGGGGMNVARDFTLPPLPRSYCRLRVTWSSTGSCFIFSFPTSDDISSRPHLGHFAWYDMFLMVGIAQVYFQSSQWFFVHKQFILIKCFDILYRFISLTKNIWLFSKFSRFFTCIELLVCLYRTILLSIVSPSLRSLFCSSKYDSNSDAVGRDDFLFAVHYSITSMFSSDVFTDLHN